MSTLEERTRQRRSRIKANRAANFREAEMWDLEFWQSVSPQDRLSSLVALRRDMVLIQKARKNGLTTEK